MPGTPSWLSAYVESAEKIAKRREAQQAKAEAALSRMRPTSNPYLPPVPTGSKKEEQRRDEPHPLLTYPSFATPTDNPDEWDVRFRFIDAHHSYHREAVAAVEAHQAAAAAEQERLAGPHPWAHGPLSQVPIPEQR